MKTMFFIFITMNTIIDSLFSHVLLSIVLLIGLCYENTILYEHI